MNGGDPRFDRALVYRTHGQTNEAIEMLTELLGEEPDEPIYHAVLADCLLKQKRLIGAEFELDLAQGLDPNLPEIYLIRSQLQLLKRKFDSAQANAAEALRLNPEYVEALLMQANLYQLQERPADALEKLTQALALAPAQPDVMVSMGSFHLAQGDANKAYEQAREALRMDAGSDDANVLMGESLLALGDVQEADMHARFAISQNPHNSAALRLLVDVRMRQNWFVGIWWRFNNAVTHLSSAQLGLVLITAYLLFQLTAQILRDLGFVAFGNVLGYSWLAIVAYSWIGLPIYQRALQKALSDFRFNPKF